MDAINKEVLISLMTIFFSLPWAWLMTALATLAVVRRYFRYRKVSLDWPHARRKAMVRYKKNKSFYARHNVKASEEFVRNSRGVEIFTKQWVPANGQMRGLIFYCHGYSDTCAYLFEDVAVRLAGCGYAVASMDYEGHGQSDGLHVYITNFDSIVRDVLEYTHFVKEREEFRGLPCFLYGESMGGAVAIKAHFLQPSLWDGAVLLAPMCKIADDLVPPQIVVFLLKFVAQIFPTWKAVPTRDICSVTFRDPQKQRWGRANPTAQEGKPRLGTAFQLLKTTDEIGRRLHEVTLPLLILHGEADVVTDPSVSRALYDHSLSSDKTFRLYPDSWHSLLNGEPDDVVDIVFADMIQWLDSRSLPLPCAHADSHVYRAQDMQYGGSEETRGGMGSGADLLFSDEEINSVIN